MVSKGQFVGLDWNRITRLHSQVMTGTQQVKFVDFKMNLFLRSSIIIYIAKMWFACLIFRVMAHVLSTKFSDWMPLNAVL